LLTPAAACILGKLRYQAGAMNVLRAARRSPDCRDALVAGRKFLGGL
jgi:hypothetical protein